MNAQLKMMETNRQHEFHPAAESLSAFAEQALEERERGEVLKHLAVCGHCRQVVALAREAAEVEAAEKVAPPEIRRATLRQTRGGRAGGLSWFQLQSLLLWRWRRSLYMSGKLSRMMETSGLQSRFPRRV